MESISITANGDVYTCDKDCSLINFLENKNQNPQHVVIEVNHQALTPSECREYKLANGDKLEIVRIVAGG